jgi:HEAT repeat protein
MLLPMRVVLLAALIAAASAVLGQGAERSEGAAAPVESTLQELTRSLRSRAVRERVAAAEQLARLGRRAAPAADALIELFGDDRKFDRGVDAEGNILGFSTPADEAVSAVSGIGPPAVPALIARIDHPKAAVRRRVIEALGAIDDPRAVEPLLAAVRDHSAEVREAAIRYLPTNDPRTLEAYIAALADRSPAVRAEAAHALGPGWAPAAAFEPLLAVLQHDDDVEVVSAAILALEAIHDERVVPAFVAVVRDTRRDPLVREWAAASLGTFAGNSEAFETLLAATEDADGGVRHAAIRVIGRLGDPRVTPKLIATLDQPEIEERLAAVQALGELADPEATEPLIALLAEAGHVLPNDGPYQRQQIREAAALALGEIGDVRALDVLIAALKGDAVATVRGAAAQALGTLGDQSAVEPLIGALADVDYVRAPAATALGLLGAQRAVDAIDALLRDDLLAVRVAAVQALARLGGPRAIEALTGALHDTWPAVQREAGEALATLGAKPSEK